MSDEKLEAESSRFITEDELRAIARGNVPEGWDPEHWAGFLEAGRRNHRALEASVKDPIENVVQALKTAPKEHRHMLALMLKQVVAQELQAPSIELPPAGINPEALPVWKTTLNRYCDVIFKDNEKAQQWGTAIDIFVRSCRGRKIAPWLPDAQHTTKEPIGYGEYYMK